MGLTAAPELNQVALDALTKSLQDGSTIVRIESATALARHGEIDRGLATLAEIIQDEDPTVVLHAARAIELLGDQAVGLHDQMQMLFDRYEEAPGDLAWFIRFTTTGFLNRVSKPAVAP